MDLFAPSHVFLIVIALVFLFGGKKIPELMKGIGQGMKEFKKAVGDEPETEGKKIVDKE